MTEVVTRIAPSPTGYMHIGTARTALFNWLYARGRGGKFLLRIEDTDRERSTDEATDAILRGMEWLGLDYDGEPVSQFERAHRHSEVAHSLLDQGKAYKCFATQEEIQTFRDEARKNKQSTLFQSPWRDADPKTHPDAPYVIRIKSPQTGETIIKDEVQGNVTIKNEQLDDMVLLRSDGTPVYMLAVVVDDYDMGITHVIRGDDHLNNAARQMMIYNAMGWPLPVYAHIPLIYGDDGKKLSKRHGATSVEDYKKMGYSSAGMRNYLSRLGWSHGDDEFFSDVQALEWFNLSSIGKSAARFDFKKLQNLSGQHIAITPNEQIIHEVQSYLQSINEPVLSHNQQEGLSNSLNFIKDKAKTYGDIIDKAAFILSERPLVIEEKAQKSLDTVSCGILKSLTQHLQTANWTREDLEGVTNKVAQDHGIKFGKLAAPLRAALAGRSVTPSVFDMMLVLGRQETVARLNEI